MKTIKLLPWQQKCLEKYKLSPKPDFVVIAGTGCGKTTAGASMAQYRYSLNNGSKKSLIIVLCPYRSIKKGWKKAFERLGMNVATKVTEIAEDINVVISTYAGAASCLSAIRDEIEERNLIGVFDEFHHLEEKGEWAKPIVSGQYVFSNRIFLSGTPWRESGNFDTNFVPYKDDEVIADFTHSYGENVNLSFEDGKNTVSVRFHRKEMEVKIERFSEDGASLGTSDIKTSDTRRSDSITPFVRFDTYYDLIQRPVITDMLDQAIDELDTMRKSGAMPRAGGIVFVSGQKEGRAVEKYFADKGKKAVFVFSDDPESHVKIEAFEASNDEWVIAIDQISEGTDIPRLNVGVDLSFKLTLLHIIQRWGRIFRILRRTDGSLDKNTEAAIFCVDHAQLKYVALEIENDVKRNKRDGSGEGGDPPPKTTLRLISEKGYDKEVIFKGKTIAEQQYDLACWLIAVNYGGKFSDLGYTTALAMAEVFISTDTIPKEFFEAEEKPEQEFNELTHRQKFNKAVDDYSRKTKQIAYEFYEGDFSAASNAVNRAMGVSSFSKDGKTLVEVEARLSAATELYRRLKKAAA